MANAYKQRVYSSRCQIFTLIQTGKSQSEIAILLGMHKSTISRELKRNSGQKGYRHEQAQSKCAEWRKAVPPPNQKLTPNVEVKIIEGLVKQWSPEQISGRLALEEVQVSSRVY